MSFAENCYQLLMQVPKGRVTTYKIIAKKLGTKAYRAVGQVMACNRNAPKIPCHRVVKSDGNLGGYAFGLDKKIAILEKEGVSIIDGKIADFKKLIFKF